MLLIFILNVLLFEIAEAILFFIKVSIKLLSLFMIIWKSEINAKILIYIIYLNYFQDFDSLINTLYLKLD